MIMTVQHPATHKQKFTLIMLFSLSTSSLLLQCRVLLPKLNLYWTALPTQPVWSGRPATALISTSSKRWEWRNMRLVVRQSHSPVFLRISCAATPTTSPSLLLTVCATSPPVASHSWEQVKFVFFLEHSNVEDTGWATYSGLPVFLFIYFAWIYILRNSEYKFLEFSTVFFKPFFLSMQIKAHLYLYQCKIACFMLLFW